ncbi:GNAT family N-acetyltransferase [Paenibacillus chartarius]|uniref:GNAT family N-acetyltransferase n=1 Tax=Paenibacillus chartarius TaxID=747481 RepID=A0ABV6DSH7_9BACL
MNIELIELQGSEGEDVYEMIVEMGAGQNGFVNSLLSDTMDGFHALIKHNVQAAQGIGLAEGRVPQTVYVLYTDGKPVGYGKLRHCLNEKLRQHGGHIGYVIRPTARGQGYGAIILRELLRQAAAKNIPEVLLTCDESNTASRRIIEGHLGRLTGLHEGVCQYWITLRDTEEQE